MSRKVEKLCRQAIDNNPNMLVPWYLMMSYLYYCENDTVIGDCLFNDICQRLIASWGSLSHRHKGLIVYDDLAANTGFSLKADEYPQIIRSAAIRLLAV